MLLRKTVLLKSAIDKSLSRLNDIIAIKFPGGKFEDGEDGPTCLHRELAEELGVDAQIGDLITIAKHATDSGKVIELHTYEITSYTGEIQLHVHDDMHWVPVPDLPSHPQLPADLLVSQTLYSVGKY